MKNIFAVILIMTFVCGHAYSQQEKLRFNKLPGLSKTRTIKKGAHINIDIRSFTADSNLREDIYEGKFIGVASDSMIIELDKRTTNTGLGDGLIKQEVLARGFCANPLPYTQENVALEDISGIAYKNKASVVTNTIGTVVFFASFFTTTLIAPLVSINYGKGTFNFERYRAVAVAGAIGVGISIPILVLTGNKKLALKKELQYRKKPLWTYESD